MATPYLAYLPWLLCALPIVYAISSRPKGKLPPGPKRLPVLGNIFDIPTDEAWKVFQTWGEQYGDVIYLETLGKKMVVLNSAAAAFELLNKRNSIYSYRPKLTMVNEVIGWKFSLPSMDYGEKSRRHRRYLQSYFQKSHLKDHYGVQTKELHRLLNDLLDSPQAHWEHIRRTAAGITMMIAYGHKVESENDEFIAIADKGIATINAAGAIGAHIVDFVPWFRFIPDWFPGASIKSIPPGTRENLQTFLRAPFERIKQNMAEGSARPCYVTKTLEETKGLDDEGVRGTAATVYTGGLDTTLSSMMTAFMMLTVHQGVQSRLQAEMDLVIGKDRLPDFSDKPRLPYLHCVMLETLRWGATTPVGTPHRVSQDDEYNGYLIPADSTIMANQWAMLRDERVYPDPYRFDPDRFLEGEGHTPQDDPRNVAFGFGRRICPGMDLAENTLWITIASIFYAFKVIPALDDKDVPVPIDLEFHEHGVRYPKPFKCNIAPRNESSVELIRAAYEA
ncbi:cytochrome P450 [Irpex lacteus]|nr:cytochrome P450 [Irpex lacteus]